MTDKQLRTLVGEAQSPVQDLTDYVDWVESRFISQAYNGESSVASIVFRDEQGQMGPAITEPIVIAARNEVEVKHGSNFLYRGRFIDRTWERGAQKAFKARVVTANTEDVNVELRGLIVDQWVRPEETDRARVLALREAYLDGSVRVGANLSTGLVSSSNTITLPAKTYTQTDPLGVMQDVAFQTHKQFFVTIDKELFYDGWDSTAYACPFRITDDEAELRASPTTTLGIIPDSGPMFAINGQRFVSYVRLYYGSGATDRVDGSNPTFERWKAHWEETVHAPEGVDNATEAAAYLETLVQERSQDGRTYTLSVCAANGGPLTEAHIGSLKPGMLIRIKSRIIPNPAAYDYYTTRIVTLQWHMPLPGQYFATLKLERPEKTYGIGQRKGPSAPGAGQPASCLLSPGDMTEIATPNGDVETGLSTNWSDNLVTAGDPFGQGGSWHQAVGGIIGSGGFAYYWPPGSWVAGTTYVCRFYYRVTGAPRVRFGAEADLNAGSGDYAQLAGSELVDGLNCIEWTPASTQTDAGILFSVTSSGSITVDNVQAYTGSPGDDPGDIVAPGDGSQGTDSGVYANADHDHEHPVFTTGDLHSEYVREAILTTAGDLPYATGASTWTRRAIGASNWHLRSDGTQPIWSPESSGLTNPMDAIGDLIRGGVSGTPTKLAIGASNTYLKSIGTGQSPLWATVPTSGGGAPDAHAASHEAGGSDEIDVTGLTGAGGGGGGWTLAIDEDGSSAANWTTVDGSWSSDGSDLIGANNGDAAYRHLRYNTAFPSGLGIAAEVDMLFPSASQGTAPELIAGMSLGHDGTGDVMLAVELQLSEDRIMIHNVAATLRTQAVTINTDTTYTLRAEFNGIYISVYVDGTLLATTAISKSQGSADYFSIHTYKARCKFRNIKVWHLTPAS